MKKRILAALMACVVTLGLAGCSGSNTSSTSGSDASTSSDASATTGDASATTSDAGTTDSSATGATGDANTEERNPGLETHQLANPNAIESAQKVYDYICESYGKTVMAGQQESTWKDNNTEYEMEIIEANTGKLPAVRGFDFMKEEWDDIVTRATEWWEKGGIVTICWHTGIYEMGTDGYAQSSKDVADWDKLFDETTEEHKDMLAHWDEAAAALARLQDAGVPVLWRPFHEFDGDYFWWAKDAEGNKTEDGSNLVKLWQMMYNYYTNEKGLNNLIWVYAYGGTVKEGWYCGDEYCDIIGSDSYANDSYEDEDGNMITTGTTNKTGWDRLQTYASTNKPMAFHECGVAPSVEKLQSDETIWSWFMVWHTDHLDKNNGQRFGENFKELYNSDLVVTLDELPSFK